MHPKNQKIPRLVEDVSDPFIEGTGRFIAGTTAVFFFHFPDIDGKLYDPSDTTLSIVDPDDTEVEAGTELDRLDLGEFAYSWAIPSDSTTGAYTLTLTYVVETEDGPETRTYSEDFVVGENIGSDGSVAVNRQKLAMRGFLESLIGYVQRIPVYREIVRFDTSRTLGRVTFGHWNQAAGVRVYRNDDLIEDGFVVDYVNGEINFVNPLTEYDEIKMDYNFRWFADQELDDFILQGIREINIFPPQSNFTLISISRSAPQWVAVAEYSAAVNALRRWMMDLMFQEPVKIFGGPERAKDVFSQMDTLKKNYEEWLKLLLEQKKYGPYVGLTRTITTPMYTLPGGRSRWFRYLFSGGAGGS